jgi:pimeloyl-ACP methyl ester carboxylesterase
VTGLLGASIKYVTAVPDLLGYGVSTVMHPYIHAGGNTPVIIDYLNAVRSYCQTNNISLNDEVFLAGYSEGGYLTLALQKEIEENYSDEFSLSAVAPMAGPCDLNYLMEYILDKDSYDNPAYIAFFMTAYDKVYQWNRIDEIFTSAYAPLMSTYFDGSYTFGYINSRLPTQINQLIHPDFISGYHNGTETEFVNAINENDLLNWAPQAPVRLIHGDADSTVPYQIALNTLDNLKKSGAASIDLVTISGGTHATAGVPAIVAMIEWFETFRSP